jgi:hypothetical protein
MDEAPSPADRRESQRHRARRRTRVVVGIVVGLVVVAGAVAAVVALGGGGDGSVHHRASATTRGDVTTVDLQVGEVASDSAGPAATFSAAQAQDLLTVIRTYIDRAIVTPLRTGQPPGDLATVFDAGTLARVIGPDQGVMTDAGVPKVSGDLTVRAKPVAFVALGDQSGTVVLVSAALDLTVDGRVEGAATPLQISRTGDFALAPDAAGAWKVTSYSMSVSRSGGGIGTTTTGAPATTKVAK